MSQSLVARETAVIAGRGDAVAAPVKSGALRPGWLYHVVLLALSGGVLLMALLLSIRGQSQVVLPLLNVPLPELCMSRRMFGLSCPGCGLTRCFISLARGDVGTAWSYNPAGLLLFAVVAFQIPLRAWQLWRIRGGLPEVVMNGTAQVALSAVAVLMLGQWALRLMGVAF
jgi:hypothetical protein